MTILASLTLVASVTVAQEPDLHRGLVAYYPFNGNANDESGNGNDAIVKGASLTADRNGEFSKAYKFDGNNDYIAVNSSQAFRFQQHTISAWVNYIGSSNLEPIISTEPWLKSDGFSLAISAKENRIGYKIMRGSTQADRGGIYDDTLTKKNIVKPGTWFHV
ncbi:MAG: hypothetical protein QGG39_19205, partial [Candidatus Poribacteria bacterium]|nr:hypothetical protein [Candidatus Poribacteria bacterium]